MSWASAHHHPRYMQEFYTRRKCRCGCEGRITHAGMANGIALYTGCELSVRRWVKDPKAAFAAFVSQHQQGSTRRT